MVRRRRNELDARCRIAQPRDDFIHLVPRQLAPFSRLGALRHLDLEFLRIGQIVAGHAEPRRRDLFDIAVLRIAVRQGFESLRIFTTLAGIALGAQAVHGNRERLVRFLADRAVRHGSGREPFHDLLGRLNLVDGDRRWQKLEVEQAAQVRPSLALIVDELRELSERFGIVRLRRVLQFIDRVRIPIVVFALDAIMNLAAEIELPDRRRLIGQPMPPEAFFADLANTDSLDPRRRPGEVPVDHVMVQADRLEDLGAAIGLDGGNPHLREDLEQPLIDRFDVLAFSGLGIQPFRQIAVPFHIDERFED